jgi:hypothetical protein
MRADGSHRAGFSHYGLVPAREGNQLPDDIDRDGGKILVDFLNGGSGLEIGHYGIRLDAGVLNDRPTTHLAGNSFDELAIAPVHAFIIFFPDSLK